MSIVLRIPLIGISVETLQCTFTLPLNLVFLWPRTDRHLPTPVEEMAPHFTECPDSFQWIYR
jgi:hypothetical protein